MMTGEFGEMNLKLKSSNIDFHSFLVLLPIAKANQVLYRLLKAVKYRLVIEKDDDCKLHSILVEAH